MKAIFVISLLALAIGAGPLTRGQSVVVAEAGSSSLPASTRTAAQPAKAALADDYVIGADDSLAINVWKEPDLCRTVPVRPDGKKIGRASCRERVCLYV